MDATKRQSDGPLATKGGGASHPDAPSAVATGSTGASVIAASCPACLAERGCADGVAYRWPDGVTMCCACGCPGVEPIDLDAPAGTDAWDPAYFDDGDGWDASGSWAGGWAGGFLDRHGVSLLVALGAAAAWVAFVLLAKHLASGG